MASADPSIHPFIPLSIRLFINQPNNILSIHPSFFTCIYLSVHLFHRLPSICMSFHLFIRPSIYLVHASYSLIHSSIYPFINYIRTIIFWNYDISIIILQLHYFWQILCLKYFCYFCLLLAVVLLTIGTWSVIYRSLIQFISSLQKLFSFDWLQNQLLLSNDLPD